MPSLTPVRSHFAVHRSDNLAHRVGGDRAFLAAEHHLVDERQTERGLARGCVSV